MNVILSKAGIKRGYFKELKLGVVYDRKPTESSNGSSHYILVNGSKRYCSTDSDFLEVPDGYFVVRVTETQPCYSWEVGDYLVATDSDEEFYKILHSDFTVCLKHHAEKVSEPTQEVSVREVRIPTYIVLEQPIDGLTVGMHYEVLSINISGSYMVTNGNDYSNTIVAPAKCHRWINGQYKTVPCRCPTFEATPMPAVPPVAHIEFDDSIPWEPEEPKKRAPKLVPDTLTSENKKIIKKQKALAAELLERLGFYGNAIIAGGAPRNWWFNRPANDLDIFIPAPQDFTGKNLRAIMEREGITDVFNMATHNPDGTLKASKAKEHTYDERMSDIHSVFEGKYCGQQVQVIWINVSTYGYIESHFDTSINMIFSTLTANGDVAICPTREFNQGVETGAIYVHDKQAAYTNAHLEKVANYFPKVPLVWYEELKECVKNPSLVLEVAKSWEDHIQDQLDAQRDFDDCW